MRVLKKHHWINKIGRIFFHGFLRQRFITCLLSLTNCEKKQAISPQRQHIFRIYCDTLTFKFLSHVLRKEPYDSDCQNSGSKFKWMPEVKFQIFSWNWTNWIVQLNSVSKFHQGIYISVSLFYWLHKMYCLVVMQHVLGLFKHSYCVSWTEKKFLECFDQDRRFSREFFMDYRAIKRSLCYVCCRARELRFLCIWIRIRLRESSAIEACRSSPENTYRKIIFLKSYAFYGWILRVWFYFLWKSGSMWVFYVQNMTGPGR